MKQSLLILTVCLFVLVGLAKAQQEPTLANLEVAIWPEFDQPEVLVIQRGLLAEDVSLPVGMEIRIPASAGQPSAVAYVDEAGQRFNQQYTTRAEGDWLIVAFELTSKGFQLEYYDPLATDSSGQREYAYTYVADYPVADFTVEFQVPPTAGDFALEPPADAVATESDGLVYHSVAAGSLAEGEQLSWTMTYQKGNEDLTVSAFAQPDTSVPTASPAGGDDTSSTVLIFFVAFVALVAVGGAAFWLGRQTQEPVEVESASSPSHKRRGSGRGGQTQSQRVSSLQTSLFCHQCGAELRRDSEFCHRCGTRVR
jgi:hypothetical protein